LLLPFRYNRGKRVWVPLAGFDAPVSFALRDRGQIRPSGDPNRRELKAFTDRWVCFCDEGDRGIKAAPTSKLEVGAVRVWILTGGRKGILTDGNWREHFV